MKQFFLIFSTFLFLYSCIDSIDPFGAGTYHGTVDYEEIHEVHEYDQWTGDIINRYMDTTIINDAYALSAFIDNDSMIFEFGDFFNISSYRNKLPIQADGHYEIEQAITTYYGETDFYDIQFDLENHTITVKHRYNSGSWSLPYKKRTVSFEGRLSL